MVMVKATRSSEAGVMPDAKLLQEMRRQEDELRARAALVK